MKLEFIANSQGKVKGVVIPIEVWKKAFPNTPDTWEELVETLEDYCLNKAMEEAKETPLLTREEALQYLNEE